MVYFLTFYVEKSTSKSDFYVIRGKSESNLLSLSIHKHCFAEKELEMLLFSLKSAINFFGEKNGMQEVFPSFNRVFKRVFFHRVF